jgi:hypothetical protein
VLAIKPLGGVATFEGEVSVFAKCQRNRYGTNPLEAAVRDSPPALQ